MSGAIVLLLALGLALSFEFVNGLSKPLIKRPELYAAPEKGAAPPPWIRGLLVLTCTGVSLAHGSNDGQKGMGLIMLILIGIIPGAYALNIGADHTSITQLVAAADAARPVCATAAGGVLVPGNAANDTLSAFLKTTGQQSPATYGAIASLDQSIADRSAGPRNLPRCRSRRGRYSGPMRISSPRRSRSSIRKNCSPIPERIRRAVTGVAPGTMPGRIGRKSA